MKHLLSGFFACTIALCSIGCDSKPTNIMEDADAEAVAEYERLTAEAEAQANSDAGDQGDADDGDF